MKKEKKIEYYGVTIKVWLYHHSNDSALTLPNLHLKSEEQRTDYDEKGIRITVCGSEIKIK